MSSVLRNSIKHIIYSKWIKLYLLPTLQPMIDTHTHYNHELPIWPMHTYQPFYHANNLLYSSITFQNPQFTYLRDSSLAAPLKNGEGRMTITLYTSNLVQKPSSLLYAPTTTISSPSSFFSPCFSILSSSLFAAFLFLPYLSKPHFTDQGYGWHHSPLSSSLLFSFSFSSSSPLPF